ncbi:MAG: zinc-binding dehydrogenase [Deltaproteobacteria bacterium]|nr:zinc-binding dehydrogenase [Deltaproteobacteria bacterium]
MKAITLREHGGVEVLKYEELPDKKLRSDLVRVRIRAVALNHLDLWIRKGLPHIKHRYPHILGSDIAGEILDLGAFINDLKIGQKVLIHPALSCGHCEACSKGQDNLCPKYQILGEHVNGGYAEYIDVPRQNILPYPENLSFSEAACVPLVFLTAWQMLIDRAKIRPGQLVVIHGGGSGMGSAGIQVAKLFGCEVITTAGSEEKLAQAQSLGADYLINYKKENFLEAVQKIAGKQKVDVVFEHVGKAFWKESLLCLKWGGILVTCGATTGYEVTTDLRQIFFRQIQVLGSTIGSRGSQFEILRHISSGKLKPILDQEFALKDAHAAHERLEAGKQFGKIVLIPE